MNLGAKRTDEPLSGGPNWLQREATEFCAPSPPPHQLTTISGVSDVAAHVVAGKVGHDMAQLSTTDSHLRY